MKERGVAIRGLVSLVLCATAAARMPLAGKAAFANHTCLWGRRLPHGRRSAGAALRFSSSAAAADGDLADDELDALVKTAVSGLPSRPRVAVVGGTYTLFMISD